MDHNFNSGLLCRFAVLSLLAAFMFVDVSFGMKRAGDFGDDRGDNKRQKTENTSRQCPLSQQLIDLKHDGESIGCSSISPDGHFLAVGYTDGLVKIWNIFEGRYTGWLDAQKEGSVLSIEWSRDAQYIATYIDGVDGDDHPIIAVWKRDENNTFVHHLTFNMEHDSSADFAFTRDACSFITMGASCIENRIFDDLNKVKEIKKSKEFNTNCLIKKICITPHERGLLYCFSESGSCILYFFQLSTMNCVCAFKIAGSLLDCTLSPQNRVLLLRKTGFDRTTAACYQMLITAKEKTFKLLFELNNDNFILNKLSYSSDGAFIVGQAKSQAIRRGAYGLLNASVVTNSPSVLVWDYSGRLLKKVSFIFENITGELRILDAKVVGSILHIVFSEDNDTWVVTHNLVNTFQCLKNRQYGIQPSFKDIQIQSLRICIDKDKRLNIEIANQPKK